MAFKSKYTGYQIEDMLEKGAIAVTPKDIAKVATSGSFNDLSNVPIASTSGYGITSLSDAVNSTEINTAATSNAVKKAYDLAASKGNGTVTGIKMNGITNNPSSGVVDLGTVITAHQTLKTINGESIVGSGDITISGDSSGANVQAVDTQETIDSVDGFKTINGQSILGSGNIEISGSSSGSGEVYITPFTVEQFCTGYVELTDERRNELLNAASQNRIIGMPYGDYGSNKGYIITDYRYYSSEDDDSFWGLDLQVIYNGAHYYNHINSNGNMNFSIGRLNITPFKPLIYPVTVEDGVAYVSNDAGHLDNCIYFVDGECAELNINIEPGVVDCIIKFFTGENCSLYFTYDVCWSNGKLPTIEPYTEYELSLSTGVNGVFNAVLTKFKFVE